MSDVWLIADALEVTSITLNTRLVSEHLHEDTSLWRVERSTNLCIVTLAVLVCIQTEVVVDTAVSILDLIEVNLTNCIADSVRCGEVEWSILNWLDLTCWDVERVRRSEVVSIEIENHVSTYTIEVTIEVVIVVVCLIDDSLLICCSLPSHIESIVCRYLIYSCSGYITRITILTVSSLDCKLEDRVTYLLCLIYLMHPTCCATAMKAVRTVIKTKLIILAVE